MSVRRRERHGHDPATRASLERAQSRFANRELDPNRRAALAESAIKILPVLSMRVAGRGDGVAAEL
ncbi:hypothetical protein AB0C34_27150 [Nocardia sp. NPDC049220]|uniref:hypothetical protein n=1 Tax=Nocardia sp. NPDC049220 TaxID=3155273 RepID=UPI0033DBC12E